MARKKTNPFKGRTGDAAREQKRRGSKYGHLLLPTGIGIFKEETSERPMRFDILSYRVSEDTHHPQAKFTTPEGLNYTRPFKIHRNIGSENESVICLSSIGKKCPICIARAEMVRQGENKETTDAIKAKDRQLYYVIPLGHKDYEEKPYIWDISFYNFQELLNDEILTDEDYEGFPSLEDGLTLHTRFAEKSIGKGKPFPQASRIDFKKREEQHNEDTIKDLPDLVTVLNALSFKELERKFLEIDDDDEGASDPGTSFHEKEQEQEPEAKSDIDSDECIACEGSGENSKGGECPICKGSGEKPEKSEPPEESEKNKEKARRQRIRDEKKKAKADDNEERCRLGHKFGVDTDDHPECDDCKLWDDCIEEKDKADAK